MKPFPSDLTNRKYTAIIHQNKKMLILELISQHKKFFMKFFHSGGIQTSVILNLFKNQITFFTLT